MRRMRSSRNTLGRERREEGDVGAGDSGISHNTIAKTDSGEGKATTNAT